MILVALGGNLPSRHGSPRQTLAAALDALAKHGIKPVGISRFYVSLPVPPSPQPNYVNAVVAVETALSPAELLSALHLIEAEFGRRRTVLNEARSLDLDLIDYQGRVTGAGAVPELPHPRMHERAFVLAPLSEVAPGWRHPVLERTVDELLAEVPAADRAQCRPAQ